MNNRDRKFGCEFEFSSSIEQISSYLSPAIINIYGEDKIIVTTAWCKSTDMTRWYLKKDSTTLCELTTPVSFFNDLVKIKKVLKVLEKNSPRITRNDSLHMHIDASDVSKQNLIFLWMKIEPIFLLCLPKHRRNNTYCEKINHIPINNKYWFSALAKGLDLSNEHHSLFSLYYYKNKRKTVEFRGCEGTYDFYTMNMFLHFYMAFISRASKIDLIKELFSEYKIETIDDMFFYLKINNNRVKEFFRRRFEVLN
jgi:hypothetical protein